MGLLLGYVEKKEPERAKALRTAIDKAAARANRTVFRHRVDTPDRPTPRFLAHRIDAAKSAARLYCG